MPRLEAEVAEALKKNKAVMWKSQSLEPDKASGDPDAGGDGVERAPPSASDEDVWCSKGKGLYSRKGSKYYGVGQGHYMEENIAIQMGYKLSGSR